jgi:hypothetical protein
VIATKIRMTKIKDGPYGVKFVQPDDQLRRPVIISPVIWADLGRPDEITVTIEVGDTLNP